MKRQTLYAAMLCIPVLCCAEEFNIKGLTAPLALNEFSRQANIQVLYDYSVVEAAHVNDVSGEMLPAEALRIMLEDSGLEVDMINQHTLSIMPVGTKLEMIDSVTLARWLRAFDDGPAMSYPYDNTQPTGVMVLVLPTGEEIQCGMNGKRLSMQVRPQHTRQESSASVLTVASFKR